MSSDPEQPEGQPSAELKAEVSSPGNTPAFPPGQPAPDGPAQNPYWQQPVLGTPLPSFYERPAGYGYVPPQGIPLPLGQAMRGLLKQYVKILTRPGARSFEEEQGKATWGMIWMQLLVAIVVGTIAGLIHSVIITSLVGEGVFSNSYLYNVAFILPSILTGGGMTTSLFYTIIAFFAIAGLQYLLARIVGGNGYFKQQGYNYLLFYVPLTLIGIVLQWVPLLGLFAAPLLWVYQIVLNVFSIMAAHRLSGGKASVVVLVPIGVVAVLGVLLIGVFLFLLSHYSADSSNTAWLVLAAHS